MNDMFDFICMGFVEQWGAENGKKFKMKIQYMALDPNQQSPHRFEI